MWLLLLITLQIANEQMTFSEVENSEIVKIVATEKECNDFAFEFMQRYPESDPAKKLFCMPMNGKKI